ncbi:MAG: TolC family protein [Saprospiraceae bacterium]|nr:TolC family protein [Saprospiraceae bacterium]
MKSNTLYIAIFFFIGISSLGGQSSLTLEDILSEARDNALSVQNAKMDVEIAASQLNLLKAELKPNLGLDLLLPNFINTSAQVTQPDGSIAFQQVTQNNSSISLFANQNISATGGQLFVQSDLQRFDDFSTDAKQYNGVPIRIGFIQPLFGFNRFKWSKKILTVLQEESANTYHIAVENVQWRATNLYFNVLLAQANQEIATTNKGVNEKLVEITKERFELGKTSRDELLQIEMSLKSAILSENQAKNEVEQSLRLMYTFLGNTTIPTNITCTVPKLPNPIQLDESTLLNKMVENRPEILRYQRELIESERDIAQTKAQYGISAELFAGFGFARGSENIDEIYNNPFDEQQVRFSVSLPLVDWGQRREAVKITQLRKASIQNRVHQETLELENRVRTGIAQFEQIQSDLILLQEIKEVAEERFEISNQRYTLGNISITDLTLAQREKDQTLRDFIRALRVYWSTYYELRTLCGTTTFN